jgi:hypothetical protein
LPFKKGEYVRWRQFDRADSPSLKAVVLWVSGATATIRVIDGEGPRWIEEVETRMLDKEQDESPAQ